MFHLAYAICIFTKLPTWFFELRRTWPGFERPILCQGFEGHAAYHTKLYRVRRSLVQSLDVKYGFVRRSPPCFRRMNKSERVGGLFVKSLYWHGREKGETLQLPLLIYLLKNLSLDFSKAFTFAFIQDHFS